jgi:hypothetical protein
MANVKDVLFFDKQVDVLDGLPPSILRVRVIDLIAS